MSKEEMSSGGSTSESQTVDRGLPPVSPVSVPEFGVKDIPAYWLGKYDTQVSLHIMETLARIHAEQAGPFRDELLRLIDAKDWLGLVNYEQVYPDGLNPYHVLNARQATAFFQKCEWLDLGLDKEGEAIRKFISAERDCANTNIRLRQGIPSGDVASVMLTAQRKIADVLGDVPLLESLQFAFGPGANTTVRASASSPRFKLGSRLACSTELASSVHTVLAEAPQWCRVFCQEDDDHPHFRVPVEIHFGKLQFVPKTAKTYRSIVVEPTVNSFAQKGIGSHLRRRLQIAGLDLSDQSRNQKLAYIGSLNGSLATVDLSSASDTISRELVAELLPLDWYSFLSRFRTGTIEYRLKKPLDVASEIAVRLTPGMLLEHDKLLIHQQKFSSMGNAFTFELESLIFWALTHAVCAYLRISDKNVSVYGDDIIIPVEGFPLLEKVFTWCGFTVNSVKSYHSGFFRESCGSDWYLGNSIRPYYLKKVITAETLFSLHNFYVRAFEFALASEVLKWIHPSLRIYGPDGFGDGHLVGSYSPRRTSKCIQRGWEGVVFDTYVRVPKRKRVRFLPGDRALPSYSIYVLEDSTDTVNSDHTIVRGETGRYKRVSIYTLKTGIFR